MTGIILIVIGLAIRIWAIRAMNGRFTLQVRPVEKLCTSGPYRLIRHPAYLGTWIVIIGLSLVHVLAGIAYIAFLFFLARAIQEEMLLGQLKEYQDYQKKTGMFLPKLRRS
jgi:protein-S-isoprenylcysteine O-methyltransferase Ste14